MWTIKFSNDHKCRIKVACVRFTDGIKTVEETGAGVCTPDTGNGTWFHLGNFPPSSKQRLLLHIWELAEWDAGETSFFLFRAGIAYDDLQGSEKVYRLSEKWDYSGCWVPGHLGVEGNEIADEFARYGSSATAHEPEPFIPIAQLLYAKDWVMTEHWWSSYDGEVHTKHFWTGIAYGEWVVGAIIVHCGTVSDKKGVSVFY